MTQVADEDKNISDDCGILASGTPPGLVEGMQRLHARFSVGCACQTDGKQGTEAM